MTRIYRSARDIHRLSLYTMGMENNELEYRVFLVRVWQGCGAQAGDWLAQVECLTSGERFYLGSPQELFAFVQEWICGQGRPGAPRLDITHRRTR